MRLRSKLFYIFLALFFIPASIVEASKRREGGGKKGREQNPALIILCDAPGSGREIPVGRNFGPNLESERAKDNKENVGEAFSPVEEGHT